MPRCLQKHALLVSSFFNKKKRCASRKNPERALSSKRIKKDTTVTEQPKKMEEKTLKFKI
jgi:hypothetical protein